MARRPDFFPDAPLSPAALAELRQRYAMLSMSSLQQVYADAWERCKLEKNGQLPRAEQIQVLAQVRHGTVENSANPFKMSSGDR
jgi:hypothetical protein